MSKIGNLETFRDGAPLLRKRLNDMTRTINYLMRQRRSEIVPRVRGGSGGGAGIRKAYCLVDAGSAATIACTLGDDGSGVADWDSLTTYNSGDWVAHNGSVWQSTIDANQGNEPGVDEGWITVTITVHCELIGASGLADCFPTLTAGVMMPVWYDRAESKWRSLWWFQGHEACPGVEA